MVSRSRARRGEVDLLALKKKLAERIVKRIQANIKHVNFGRLRKSFRYLASFNKVTIFSIYWWASIVNYGRGEIRAKPGGPPLIWYKDPTEDPRIKGGYPLTMGRQKRLTPKQFERDKEAGKLIITNFSGAAEGLNFLEPAIVEARADLKGEMRKLIQGRTRELLESFRKDGKIKIQI